MLIAIYDNWTLCIPVIYVNFPEIWGKTGRTFLPISPTLVLHDVTFWQLMYN